jgi:DNA-binding MarR family transcriptional regulator
MERDERRVAWRVLVETLPRLLEQLGSELESAHGVTLPFYDVLLHLDEAPRPLRMHELADAVALSRSGLTKRVDAMERAGLVVRSPSAGDRRSIDISLTDEGRALFQRAAATHVAGIEEHFARHLSPGDGAALLGALANLPAAREALRRERERGR